MTLAQGLFDDFSIGDLHLSNRMVMAPLTRSRAGEGCVPTSLMATYYAQRASAGLIISEATQVCPEGQGYIATPGIYADDQEAGWKRVVNAVHQAGGKICLQLWHVGRISHTFFQPEGAAPVAPSAIRANMKAYTTQGMVDCSEPRALTTEEVQALPELYAKAARRAKAAGFDMVEIHAANGYLIDQFLRDKTNHRTDAYGGGVENRARLLLEVAQAISSVYPASRIGCRISPASTFNDIADSNPQPLFSYAATELGRMKLGYLHVIEGETGGARDANPLVDFAALRAAFKQAGGLALVANNGYTKDMAAAAVSTGQADLIAFGVPFLANPDLVHRFQHGLTLNTPDPATFYGGNERGYTDYPTAG